MLAVQEYLQDHTLEDLTNEYAIKVKEHLELPLVILNYHQIDSPKTPQIVRECRGLVLEKDTWKLVARAFSRFFNWGEMQDEQDDFDFSDFTVMDKEDGSLIILYYYAEQWRINTRQSFAEGGPQNDGLSWTELFCQVMGVANMAEFAKRMVLYEEPEYFCFAFELCSRHNKVVRDYSQPMLVLLSIWDVEYNVEWPAYRMDYNAKQLDCSRPNFRSMQSIDEIIEWLAKKSEEDPTFEGVVIRDKDNRRWKIKSPTYLALHRLKSDGGGFMPKNVVPLILAGETAEILTYFPEMAEAVEEMEDKINAAYRTLRYLWAQGWEIPQAKQKKFALLVKDNPFSAILFQNRKNYGENETEEHLVEAWRKSSELIVKRLFREK